MFNLGSSGIISLDWFVFLPLHLRTWFYWVNNYSSLEDGYHKCVSSNSNILLIEIELIFFFSLLVLFE